MPTNPRPKAHSPQPGGKPEPPPRTTEDMTEDMTEGTTDDMDG
ncbi:hypothetical protein HEK616_05180 [Streptomyces nigrescens]|uniref:Uncharacterized protein n=1 Tax=Streptomyces nigrescens TaxID=1920 RepID=A0ABM7ZKU2_STRNI|nr:hypothetical protein HEK616_05180 [Streptomyces nigrescens]